MSERPTPEENGKETSDVQTQTPVVVEGKTEKPADVDFNEFYAVGKKLGLKKDTIDLALLIGKKPRSMLGARQILMHEQDFVRAYEFMASYQFGRGNIDGAYDAQLGLINQISSLSHYNPAFKLDPEQVESVNELRDDVGYLESVERLIRSRMFMMSDFYAYEQFIERRGYNPELHYTTVLNELRRIFKRNIDALMVQVKVALYPLASSRRNQQTGVEANPDQGSETPTDVGSLALGAVAGARPPRESKPGE